MLDAERPFEGVATRRRIGRVVVRGEFGPLLGAALPECEIAALSGETHVTAWVRDEAELFGIVGRLRDFGAVRRRRAQPAVSDHRRRHDRDGSILMAGAPTGAIGTWSTHRLLDTVIGCAFALAANYLLWPRDREAKEAVPVPDQAPVR